MLTAVSFLAVYERKMPHCIQVCLVPLMLLLTARILTITCSVCCLTEFSIIPWQLLLSLSQTLIIQDNTIQVKPSINPTLKTAQIFHFEKFCLNRLAGMSSSSERKRDVTETSNTSMQEVHRRPKPQWSMRGREMDTADMQGKQRGSKQKPAQLHHQCHDLHPG
jgi:hypothetical protein